jgi:hypothetical protein
MKNMTRGLLLLTVALATSAVYAGQPGPPGVAGVDVFVKQIPAKRSVTDAHGNFALDGLAPSSYTITFRAREAKNVKPASTTKAIIASTYSIKIEGTKHSVNQSGLTSDKLLAGIDVPFQVASGAKVRGQVLAGAVKKMVWIAPEIGSHLPGHWVEADSKEAAAHNSVRVSGDDFRNSMQRAPDPHQEGFDSSRNDMIRK